MQAVARFSSSASKRVTVGISKEVLRQNLLGRGKSYAASVKDESLKAHKVRKRISKQERRSVVASFVEKYRSSNEGRFPNISLVHKEVGGAYYAIREVFQELEYNYKLAQAEQSSLARPRPIGLKESSTVTGADSVGEKVAPTVSIAKKTTVKRSKQRTFFKADELKKEEHSGKSIDGISVEEQGHDIAATKDKVPNVANGHTVTEKVNEVKEVNQVEVSTRTLQDGLENAENSMISDSVGERVAPTVSVAKKTTVKRSKQNTGFKADELKKEEHSGKFIDGISVEEQGHDIAATKDKVPDVANGHTVTEKVNEVKEVNQVETSTRTLQDGLENSRISDSVTESEETQGKQNSKEHDQSSTTETSIWGNLKSFSNKIINFWKKI